MINIAIGAVNNCSRQQFDFFNVSKKIMLDISSELCILGHLNSLPYLS